MTDTAPRPPADADGLMRAAWYDRPGPAADVLTVGTMPLPVPAAGEVRVRLTVSGVNPGDTKKRSAWTGAAMPFPRVVPHSDGAGTVDAVGPGVSEARIGQRVWVHGAQSYRPFGTAAEATCVPADQAVPLPDAVPDELGACLGIPGITAHRAVAADGPVAGRRVLVPGVRGAVASLAAQLAVRGGATVVGSVRRAGDAADVDVPGLAGVVALDDDAAPEHILDLAGGRVDRVVEVDLAGNLALDHRVLAVGGVVAAYGTRQDVVPLDVWPLLFDNTVIRLLGSDDFPARAKRAAARELTAAAADGDLTVRWAEPLPLERIAEAHDAVDAGARAGRVLLRL